MHLFQIVAFIIMRVRRACCYCRWRRIERRGASVGDNNKDGGHVGDPAARRERSQNWTRKNAETKLGLSANVGQIRPDHESARNVGVLRFKRCQESTKGLRDR